MYVNFESYLGKEISSLMIQITEIHSGFNLFEMHSQEDFTWGHMVWHCVLLSVLHYCMPQVLEKEGEPVPFLQWRLLATLIYVKILDWNVFSQSCMKQKPQEPCDFF
jgi:hypothetical protein